MADIPSAGTVVSLSLPEHANIARNQEAFRSGVPIPEGNLQPDDAVSLFDGANRLPTVTRPLAVWPDGSVRWLLIDSVVDLDAGATKTLSLDRLQAAPVVSDPVTRSTSGSTLTVDTGPMQVEIDTERGSWLDKVVVDGQTLLDSPAPGAAADRGPYTNDAWAFAQTSNSTVGSGDPAQAFLDFTSGSGMASSEFHRTPAWHYSATVEEESALRVVVRLSGAHLDSSGASNGLYTTRLHFLRGARSVDVQHGWVYTGAGNSDAISGYGFEIPFSNSQRSVDGQSGSTVTLTHTSHDTYTRVGDSLSGRAVPLVQVSEGSNGVAVLLRDMAKSFPKTLYADDSRVRVQLFADSEGPWDLSRYSNTQGPGETNGSSVGAQGLGTGDFARIQFTTTGFPATLSDEARAFDAGPLQLWATPQWVSDARVMGMGPFVFDSSAQSEVHFRADRLLKLVEDWMRFNRDRFAWYGIEDYGDIRGWFYGGANRAEWRVEGRYGWSGNSGEPSNQLWHQCLRNQSRACFDDASALAQHSMDQQMIHFGTALSRSGTEYDGTGNTRAFAVGSMHRHGMQPYSGYGEQPEYSHVAGIETYYYLTGDQFARDALYEAAQFIYRFNNSDLMSTAAVNGVDVLSRAAAVSHDLPGVTARFGARVDEMNARLLQPGTLASLLSSPESLNFIRSLRGSQYHAERTGNADASSVVTGAADVVVANADSWRLRDDANAVSLKLPMSVVNHAVTIAERRGQDAEPYRALAQRMLELATLSQGGADHSALSLAILQSMPADLSGWQWVYEEDNAQSLLWVTRQLAFRNDDMMGYHIYRNFEALSTAAGVIPPDTPGLTPR